MTIYNYTFHFNNGSVKRVEGCATRIEYNRSDVLFVFPDDNGDLTINMLNVAMIEEERIEL